MQTFLPYNSFARSAVCLDYRRLGKQRVETKQLLLALGIPVGEHVPRNSSWSNHPAARMWRGYEKALADYGILICDVWRDRGYNDTLLPQFEEVYNRLPKTGVPPWMGDMFFHRSHQSNLLRKDEDYYRPWFPEVPNNLEYVWPC